MDRQKFNIGDQCWYLTNAGDSLSCTVLSVHPHFGGDCYTLKDDVIGVVYENIFESALKEECHYAPHNA